MGTNSTSIRLYGSSDLPEIRVNITGAVSPLDGGGSWSYALPEFISVSKLSQKFEALGCRDQSQESDCVAIVGCYWGREKAAGSGTNNCFNRGIYAKITGKYFPDINYEGYWQR